MSAQFDEFDVYDVARLRVCAEIDENQATRGSDW
jgi:hypothetical protein